MNVFCCHLMDSFGNVLSGSFRLLLDKKVESWFGHPQGVISTMLEL